MEEIDHFIIGKTFGLTNNKTAVAEHIEKIKKEKERAINEAGQASENMKAAGQQVIDTYKACCQQVFVSLDTIREKTEQMMSLLEKHSKQLLSEDPKIKRLADTIWETAEKKFNQTLEHLQAASPPILEKTETALQSVTTMTAYFQTTLTSYSEALKKTHIDIEELHKGEFVGNGIRCSIQEEL